MLADEHGEGTCVSEHRISPEALDLHCQMYMVGWKGSHVAKLHMQSDLGGVRMRDTNRGRWKISMTFSLEVLVWVGKGRSKTIAPMLFLTRWPGYAFKSKW